MTVSNRLFLGKLLPKKSSTPVVTAAAEVRVEDSSHQDQIYVSWFFISLTSGDQASTQYTIIQDYGSFGPVMEFNVENAKLVH